MVTVAQIQKNLSTILQTYNLQKSLLGSSSSSTPSKPINPLYDKDPPKHIRGYKQGSTDVTGDSTLTARDIGNLTEGKTRLNIVSALTKNDNVDFFKFTATTNEKLGIAVTTDKGVHVQILDGKGRVIADSEAKFGEKYDNFKKAGAQNLDITKGQYFLKVTRDTGALSSVKPNYAIQISSTRYYEADYDTTERPAAKVTYGSVGSLSGLSLNDLLVQVNGNPFDFANGSYYSKKV
ncbi:MAG: hypothetical protein K2Q32_00870 [Alphaproteobacteria bacterium]|nr:hypothetical protein [Alphaproteobacteria bacterium]